MGPAGAVGVGPVGVGVEEVRAAGGEEEGGGGRGGRGGGIA